VVIRAHYGLGQPAQTLTQIGGTLGLTAERARQIEVAALDKLRDALAQRAPPAPVGLDERVTCAEDRTHKTGPCAKDHGHTGSSCAQGLAVQLSHER
jgi:hypothetical protein